MALKHDPAAPLPPGRAAFGVASPPGDSDGLRHAREWLAHVEAGRIGQRLGTDPEIVARRERNERIILGKKG
ncbi:hypothetical protein [Erythrobacter sp. JK5]|uniref:hypothetical protein n=1 Tax=Erythrobacter sp. JK5 TaxID=2829500 RepID=UPI001BA68E21|nr:hypothetical protein [Erythrobacter sp. JK5]QUL38371.1 hypothetical protein KDC96_02850 [Erythrobacter sp. JK5]